MHSPTQAAENHGPLPLPPCGVAVLDHLGVIEVRGADNTSFLQSQLSNDLRQLSPSQARLAAFCSAKGRMQASFIALRRANDAIVLVCSRDLLAATVKRLSMFVMRAKAQLRDATADYAVYGWIGHSGALGGADLALPWQARTDAYTSVVQLYPTQGLARQLWLAPAGSPAPSGTPITREDWHYGDVLSGVATVSAAVVDAFVPQMLNYESVGGVSFKKGCYPGQEVVARSQFRGSLKRRAFIAQMHPSALDAVNVNAGANPAPLFAGQAVYSDQDASQPCGQVVQAAHPAAGPWIAIVCIQTNAASGERLHAGSAQGPALALLPLPYAVLEDI